MTQNSWVGGDAVCDHALSLAVGRALEKAPQFIAGMPGAIALLVSEMSPSCYIAALGLCLFKEKEDDRPSLMAAFDDELPKNMINRYRTHCLTSKRSVIVARQEADLPQPVRLAVDHVLHVEPMSPADLQRACKSMLGARVTEKQAIEALSYPKEHLWDALRKGRNFDLVLARLRDVCSAMSQPKLKKDTEGPKLEAMHGYGEAKSWGLQLARDINDWRSGKIRWADVDRGALLSGPTGVGKTVYAAGLARQCDATLITTSISQWQSKGHLGDMLAAMRADFARAARETPSILFLDELDSVGDRSLFAGKNANYETQVVNALLECMDGSIAREGTVIIGATNNPASIDPAILRPGRLDRHLVINLPGIEDRINIIGQHLGVELPYVDLRQLEAATEGMSGADLEMLCREARRTARLEDKIIDIGHLVRSLPPMLEVSDVYRRRAAIHEAGHAIVGTRLHCGTLVSISLADRISATASAQSIGVAIFKPYRLAANGLANYLSVIAMLLGGIAAEDLVIGNYSDGGGLAKDSDLEKATRLATLLEAKTGLGTRLRYSSAAADEELSQLLLLDRELAASVEKTLLEQLSRARKILEDDRALLDRVTEELLHVGSMDAATFESFIRDSPRPKMAAV